MLKIRLTRTGRKNAPSYRIVVANRRDKRDGEAIAYVGIYDPTVKPSKLEVDKEAVKEWLGKGAQPTDTVRFLLTKTGVLAKPKKDQLKVYKSKPGKKANARKKQGEEKATKSEPKTEVVKEPSETAPETTK
jgi:small subunit ribosomal protein S16